MSLKEYKLKKGTKVGTKIKSEMSHLFSPVKLNSKYYESGINWEYREIIYLFDDGKMWLWSNNPSLHKNLKVVGIFSWKYELDSKWNRAYY